MLQARAQDLQRVRALQREMAALRDELLDLAARVSSVESEVQDWEQLEKKIQQVQVSSVFHLKVYGQSGVDVECRVVSFCGICNSYYFGGENYIYYSCDVYFNGRVKVACVF